jgi:molybdenum cofactor cytidylyltransferase
MGRPKLILPVGGTPMVGRVVAALRGGGAGRVIVVVPPPDRTGTSELKRAAALAGGEVLELTSATDDMRATVERGLAAVDRGAPPDGLLLAPGDCAGLTAELVSVVIARFRAGDGRAIVVPVHGGRRGHPVAIPWALARSIRDLPVGVGVNALLAAGAIEVDVNDPGSIADIDTPEDYESWAPAE